MRWVEGFHEFAGLISDALALAAKRRAVISDIAGRFPLDRVADAYRLLSPVPPARFHLPVLRGSTQFQTLPMQPYAPNYVLS